MGRKAAGILCGRPTNAIGRQNPGSNVGPRQASSENCAEYCKGSVASLGFAALAAIAARRTTCARRNSKLRSVVDPSRPGLFRKFDGTASRGRYKRQDGRTSAQCESSRKALLIRPMGQSQSAARSLPPRTDEPNLPAACLSRNGAGMSPAPRKTPAAGPGRGFQRAARRGGLKSWTPSPAAQLR
jgi:hypothetical protein